MQNKFVISLSLLILLVNNIYSQTLPDFVPTADLIGWWPLDGSGNDESGNENNGFVNGAIPTVNRYGVTNHAYSFNGIDQNISGLINDLSTLTESTLTLWAKYIGDAGGQPYDAFFQIGVYGTHTFTYSYNYSNQNLDLYSFCTGGIPSYPDINLNNEWHFIAFVDNELGTSIFIDGELFEAGLGGPTGECYQGSPLFQIGGGSDNQWVTGSLDDIGLWNRALSASEILSLYSSCSISIIENPIDLSVNVGSDASFHVLASDPDLTFQWQSDLGLGFSDLSDFGQYSGTNNDTLIIDNATLLNNNQALRCIISDDYCSDTSDFALLLVTDDLGIESNNNELVSLFPNPANEQIIISSNSFLIGATFMICDIRGIQLQTGKINSENEPVIISNLPSGFYFLIVGNEYRCNFLKSN